METTAYTSTPNATAPSSATQHPATPTWLTWIKPLGEDLFCTGKKYLVFNLVRRNLKIKYRNSILGVLWTLVTPIAMSAVYYFVFKIVLNVQIPHHLIFILTGVLSWNFVSQSILEGMESIVSNMALVTKVPMPLQVFAYVGSLTNFVTYVLALPVLLSAAYLSGVGFHSSLLALPFYGICLFLITYGFSITNSLLYIIFRDLKHMMGILLQIWFYATPVIYDENMIPEKYRWILSINPFGYLFSDLHTVWVRGAWPETSHFITVGSWALAAILIGAYTQKKMGRGLVEQI
jgi:lipopolysaccharide transport system permease protein